MYEISQGIYTLADIFILRKDELHFGITFYYHTFIYIFTPETFLILDVT